MTSNSSDNSRQDASLLIQQGDQNYSDGKYEEALRLYTEALTIYQTRKQRLRQADILIKIGDVYQSLSQKSYQEATLLYRRIAKGEEMGGDPNGDSVVIEIPGKTPGWLGGVERPTGGVKPQGGGEPNGDG